MTSFWIIAAGLTLLAIAFVLYPLFFGKSREQEDIDRNKLNIEVIRQQIAELDADLATGTLEQSQYEKAREDLERELLADVSDDDALKAAKTGGKWAFVVAAILVPAIAFPLYEMIGGYDQLTQAPAAEQAARAAQSKSNLPPLEKMIGALEARLEQEPQNLQGWQLLGRSYVALQRPQDAAKAYRKALNLAPEDPDTLLALADVLAALNNDNFTGEPAQMVEKALKLSPEHPNALWMAGVVDYQRGNFTQSVAKWNKLRDLLPPASSDLDDLNSAIKQARERAGMPPEAELPSIIAGKATANKDGITIDVDIDPALKAQAPPDATVFVFAKAASGPPMPLAVARLKVSDLPTQVQLDDSMAMMPQLRLSGFKQVLIGARVSLSGQPTASDGDPEGLTGPVSTQTGRIKLLIDRIHGQPATAAKRTPQATSAPIAKAAPQAGAATRPGIDLIVDIDPKLKGQYAPDDLLFIFARATAGPPMPLAAVRKRAADLPLRVHLDDSMAMMPQMRLSAFPKVTVGARIAKSGQPMAAPGDLEGYVSPVPTRGGETVKLTIDRIRR